jgi:PAS domain S-box-containing protein
MNSGQSVILRIFLTAAGVVAGSIVLVYTAGQIALSNSERVVLQRTAVQHLGRYLITLTEAETGQRGYLLTGDPRYLEPYRQAIARFRAEEGELRRHASAGQFPSSDLEPVLGFADQKLAELDETIRLRRERDFETALSMVREGEGKALMDQIRTRIGSLEEEAIRRLDRAARIARLAETIRAITFYFVVVLNLGFLAWSFRRIAGEIGARERANREILRQKELVSTTLASIGDGVIVTDSEGRITSLNAEAERLTRWSSAEAIGQPLAAVFRIVNEMSRQPMENPVDQVLAQGAVVGLANHALLIAKDGAEVPIDDSASPIRAPGEPPHGVILVFRDVTKARDAQRAHARVAAIVEFSGDAMISKTLQGNILTWNPAAERILGYKPEEILGKPAATLIPAELQAQEEEILGRLQRGQLYENLETFRLTKAGRRIPVSMTVSPIRNQDDVVVGVSSVLRDISDLVTAREALAQEERVLRTTLASIGDAVIVTDVRGRVSFLNAEAERLTGWTAAEAEGQDLTAVFRIVNEQTRATVENPVEKVLRLGNVVGLANHTLLIAKNGKEIPIDDSAAPIQSPGGPLFGVILVFRDFSEHKRAEAAVVKAKEDLAKVNASLEATVQERTAKLREMVDELQHVSYSITHDMRAPLRAMSSFSEILLESADSLSPECQDYCRRIMNGAIRMDRLIQDALNYSRAVLQDLPLSGVDLTPLVQGILETYPNFHPQNAEIRIEGDLQVILGNEALLTQCFGNLLSNAVKFVEPGTRPRVRIRAEPGPTTVRIWVEDNGIGIPKHSQHRLFGMFQKLDNRYEGTGIGLAIVRKVVERMGGQVGVESEPGRGSRFWVELRRPLEGGIPAAGAAGNRKECDA